MSLRVETLAGVIEGRSDGGVRRFLGIPYAAPPVGGLRWRPPAPMPPWSGVRQTAHFGPRPMQPNADNDMVFRDAGPSEDCLTLNVWTPADAGAARLPVMVWIFGGGLELGSTSEPRQDGAGLARNAVVVVSMNYRLGILGFLAAEPLAAESPQRAAGNYGLLDQVAALKWVARNIAAFGGDPDCVTLFGESAGSIAVSAHMTSPLSRRLFHRAIGQSGGTSGLHPDVWFKSQRDAGARDAAAMQRLFPRTMLDAWRAMPAQALVESTQGLPKVGNDVVRFGPQIDGAFLPESPEGVYARRDQHPMPLLAGWNRDEGAAVPDLTAASFRATLARHFGPRAAEALAHYPAADDRQAARSEADLSTDLWDVVSSTRRWIDDQARAGRPAWRYRFDLAPPQGPFHAGGDRAYHSAEIPFVFGSLDLVDGFAWRDEHRELSRRMRAYWSNFARTGDPNGPGLPAWPSHAPEREGQVLYLDRGPVAAPDRDRERHRFLDAALPAQAPTVR